MASNNSGGVCALSISMGARASTGDASKAGTSIAADIIGLAAGAFGTGSTLPWGGRCNPDNDQDCLGDEAIFCQRRNEGDCDDENHCEFENIGKCGMMADNVCSNYNEGPCTSVANQCYGENRGACSIHNYCKTNNVAPCEVNVRCEVGGNFAVDEVAQVGPFPVGRGMSFSGFQL